MKPVFLILACLACAAKALPQCSFNVSASNPENKTKENASTKVTTDASGKSSIWVSGSGSAAAITIFASSSALPVNIGRLLGEFQYGKVTLSWNMFQHQKETKCLIERSMDGSKFEQLGIADAGNLKGDKSGYDFKDAAPLPSGYYRIKINQPDGTEAYSNTVNITNSTFIPVISVNPMQFSDWISVSIDSKLNTDYLLKVVDFSGITVFQKSITVVPGLNTIKLEERIAGLINGIYTVQITAGDFAYKQKMMKK